MLKQIAKAKLGALPPPAPDATPMTEEEANSFSPMGWEQYFDTVRFVEPPSAPGCRFAVYEGGAANSTGPLFFLVHGAGQTALSWALVAGELRSHGCRVLAMDLRGHGLSTSPADAQLDVGTLAGDVAAVYEACVGASGGRLCMLAGHSVGGAVAAHAAERLRPSGLVLVDVAESAAAASFEHMAALLAARPKAFPTPAHAVRWAVAAQLPRSLQSARVSVPPQLVQSAGGWLWRTDVLAARPHWAGWYAGVTDTFLNARSAKLLLLAGHDRLDKNLTIAQMQGRFQLALLPVPTGHSVQEDAPQLTAKTMRDFANRIAALPPPRPLPI